MTTQRDYSEVTLPLAWVSEALDEIWELRQLCAYEAGVREADLDYKSYPKTRRAIAEDRIARLRDAARGHAERAVAGTSYLSLRAAMKDAGAEDALTRPSWEQEKPALARLLAGESRG